jgi:hypothetical protein
LSGKIYRQIRQWGNNGPTPANSSWKILAPLEATQKLIDTIGNIDDVPDSIKTNFIRLLQQAILKDSESIE